MFSLFNVAGVSELGRKDLRGLLQVAPDYMKPVNYDTRKLLRWSDPYLDFVEPLTAYNEAKFLTLAEPRLRCAKQTEQLGFCSVQSRHRQYRRPGSPLNNHVRQTRSARGFDPPDHQVATGDLTQINDSPTSVGDDEVVLL